MDWTAPDMYFPPSYNQQSNALHELVSLVGQLGATQVTQPLPPEPYNQYANSYELGWRDQSDFTWSQNQNPYQHQGYQSPNFHTSINTLNMHYDYEYQHNFQQPATFVQPAENSYNSPTQSFEQVQQTDSYLEDLIRQMAVNNLQFQHNTDAILQTLQTQLSELTSAVSHIPVPPAVPVSIPKPEIGGDLVQFEESGLSKEGNVTPVAMEGEEEDEDEIEVGKATQPEIEVIPEPEPILEPILEPEPIPEPKHDLAIATESKPDPVSTAEPTLDLEPISVIEEAVEAEEQLISLSQHASTLIQPVPQKLDDSGTFIHSCIIGIPLFHDCMFSFKASVNIMPTFIIDSLGCDPLSATTVVIMPAKTLSITFDDSVVCFDAFDVMSQPREKKSILCIDMIADLVDKKYMPLHAPGDSDFDLYNTATPGLLAISSSHFKFPDADSAHIHRKEFQHIHNGDKWRKKVEKIFEQHIRHLHDWDKWKTKPRRILFLTGRWCRKKPHPEDRPGPYDKQDILLTDGTYPP